MEQVNQMVARSQARSGTVNVRNFKTIKVIGKGSYGKVLLVEKKDTNKMYALKILKKGEILRRNQLEHTLDERRILVSAHLPTSSLSKPRRPKRGCWYQKLSEINCVVCCVLGVCRRVSITNSS